MPVVRVFRILLVIGGVLALAGLSLVFSSLGSSSSSTTEIPAGSLWYVYYEFDLLGGGNLRGNFQELNGGSLDLFVLTESQYASYRSGTNIGSLWSQGSSNSGAIDVALPGSGRYFLVADHAPAYEETQQEVRLTVRLSGITPTTFGSGLALLGIGVVVVSWGELRRRKFARRMSPAPSANQQLSEPREPQPPDSP